VGLVEDDEPDAGAAAVEDVAQDLGGAHDERRPRVDPALAGEQTHGVLAEAALELPELLVGERLQRRRVPGGRAATEQRGNRLLGDPGLPTPGGGHHEHVVVGKRRERFPLKACRHQRSRWHLADFGEDRTQPRVQDGRRRGGRPGWAGRRHRVPTTSNTTG